MKKRSRRSRERGREGEKGDNVKQEKKRWNKMQEEKRVK